MATDHGADQLRRIDTPGTRVYLADGGKLAVYDPENDDAYVATENALDLHEWA